MTNFHIKTFIGQINNQPIQLVNARELHQKLENGKQFSDWIQHRISKYGFTENLDFIGVHQIVNVESGFFGLRQKEIKEYHITLDMAKELCMLERSELGQKARRYFIQMEKEALQARQLPQVLPAKNTVEISTDKYIELLETQNQLLKQVVKPQRYKLRLTADEKRHILSLHQQGNHRTNRPTNRAF
ncbi:antA/AntB antirepressor family protein [Actinobacillus pleuropneumoniae]|uniref:antA/AntB antirepressor family protein n=1 Tax=Actinobacillus pleuropneumoniae TaxID=715 RepID=UPI001F2F0F82|nr:antA/AntB antirepressor family protein [Actinobacillus pleuropneumoniae]